ncbi:MAG: MBL fold metallo-hydrolase [Chloroflexi bacterium]|nr:MBL fold metallo-hydrolase [Chloroflexota bacterium]
MTHPSWDGQLILAEAQKRGWRIARLWYTHAHFDHIGGAAAIADALNPLPLVALHPADHDLWKAAGGGPLFGFNIDPGPEPTIDFTHAQTLWLGNNLLEVRHTPGHTPGHVVIYCAESAVCFCGDLIFACSVGRPTPRSTPCPTKPACTPVTVQKPPSARKNNQIRL